ncbi:MAG: hypothetical protein AseanaTS_13640 [Candidatus Pelagadaptatus aseana]|uniref:flagellar brake protein n=1 Tax=Candidatus Pelagadaptatus aseana TaxID=3120508 RepID=UPI0039B2C07B
MAILQAVMQKLSRKPEEIREAEPINQLGDRINQLVPLFELQQKRQLLEVICDRTGEKFQSLILDIDFNNNQLIIDDLFPSPAAGIFQPGEYFTVRHHKDGLVLCFSAPLEAISVENHSPIYHLRLPQSVSYQQRRQNSRMTLSKQQPLTVRLVSPWRTPWYATANNISAGGMRVIVGGNVLDQLRPGALLPLCEFSFHEDFQVRCQARAKSFRFVRRPYRHTEISLEFTDMAQQHATQIRQLISTIQEPQAA